MLPKLAMTAVAMLAACASTPPALIALPPAPQVEAAPASDAPALLLRRVTVPGYLDGFRVVTARDGQKLTLAPDEEWAERLADGTARVLRDALSQRLGAGSVLIEGDGRIPGADLTIEFLALDPGTSGTLALDARWSFVAATGARKSHSGRSRLEVPLRGSGAGAVAAATAQALGLFADVLAREAAALYPREPGTASTPAATPTGARTGGRTSGGSRAPTRRWE